MMKGKKIVATFLTMALAMTTFAGCGTESKELDLSKDGKKAVVTVDKESISLWDANFQLRLLQLQYESMYGTEIWKQTLEGDQTFDQTLKGAVMDGLKNNCVTLAQKDKYQVELSEEEKEEIKKQTKDFMTGMTEEFKNATNAEEAQIEAYITKTALSQKIADEMVKETDTSVSEEEARQMRANYVVIPVPTDAKDTEKANLAKKAKKLVSNAKKSGELATEAKKMKLDVNEATYGANNTQIPPELVEASMKLKKGEVAQEIETSYGYYVIQCTEYLDKEATGFAKNEMENQKKGEFYNKKCAELLEKAKVEVNDTMWEKVQLVDNAVIATTEAATEASSSETTENTEATTAK